MNIINGREIAKKIETDIKKSKKTGGLGVVLVGNNPASHLYVGLKERASLRVGIKFEKAVYPENISEEKIIKKIKELNGRNDITGIIVQLPLPKHLNTDKVIQTINPKKDSDGFHPQTKHTSPVLCATLHALASTGAKLTNNILMVSNSEIFPKPFGEKFKNFKTCKSKDIKKCSKKADIIITAIGKKHYLKANMVKDGVTIIDIGIFKKGNKVYGDADPKSLKNKSGWLTPVPGGIGPITVACLLKNVIKK